MRQRKNSILLNEFLSSLRGFQYNRFVKKKLIGPIVTKFASRKDEFKYDLVFAAIFKNEARFLDEWLTFHRGVGVEHFFLYNNESTDNFLEVLKPWIDGGLVTIVDWPGRGVQISAYSHCVKKNKNAARWMALIDIDEFLFSPKGEKLTSILPKYRDLPGVFVYWALFGSSGHRERPEGPVVESYTMRMDQHTAQTEKHPRGVTAKARQGKTIFNPRLVMSVDHCCPLMWSGEVRDENYRLPPRLTDDPIISWEILRINH